MNNCLDYHERATLFFSAGKDSLASLIRLKPYWHRLDVVWSNPGASSDEVIAYMAAIAKRVPNFIEVKGNQPQWIEQYGWPLDVVPVRSTAQPHGAEKPEMLFSPYTACCRANMWLPLQQYTLSAKPTLVITGQRRAESLRNRTKDEEVQNINGITYWNCINEWSDADVFRYLAEQSEPLPPGYGLGDTTSEDCWNCTAYLDHNQSRLHRLKSMDSDKWHVISRVLTAAHKAMVEQSAPLTLLVQGTQS